MLPVQLPGCPHPPKALSAALPWQEEPCLKFQQQLPPVNPACGPGQGQEKRGWTLWGITTIGWQKRCLNPASLIPTGAVRLRGNLGAHIVHEGHNDVVVQHYALWQAAAFRLPVVQQGASGWWDDPTTLYRPCPQDFLPPASDPWNFQIIWQEKTLALARVLQACAEASRAKQGMLSEAIRELQQCMALLMTINMDDVMEASLVRPVEEEWGPSLT